MDKETNFKKSLEMIGLDIDVLGKLDPQYLEHLKYMFEAGRHFEMDEDSIK